MLTRYSRITRYSRYAGGIKQVDLQLFETVPDSIDFAMREGVTININLWMFQAIRRNIPMIEPGYDLQGKEVMGRENGIMTIKAVRKNFSLGLKEAKDIVEWFFANLDRDVIGEL